MFDLLSHEKQLKNKTDTYSANYGVVPLQCGDFLIPAIYFAA